LKNILSVYKSESSKFVTTINMLWR